MIETPIPQSIQAGKYRAFITLPSATQNGYITEGGIYVEPDYNKRQEDAAAVIGYVVAASCCGLQPGDKVAVNYKVTSHGKMGDDGVFRHSRCHVINGQIVWEAKMVPGNPDGTGGNEEIIAVEYGDERGHLYWKALGRYALMKKVEIPNPDFKNSKLIVPDSIAMIEVEGLGKLVSGDCGVPPGSTVAFQPKYASLYQFENGDEYLVIDKNFIWGVVND